MPTQWDRPPEQTFSEGYDDWVDQIENRIHQRALQTSPQIEAYMKENASWMDITGNARAGLFSVVTFEPGNFVEIAFAHGVDYGWHLEFSHQGRRAIIGKTLDHFSPLWGADMAEILR